MKGEQLRAMLILVLAFATHNAMGSPYVVIGVDRTEPFTVMTAEALRIAERLIWEAGPGYQVSVRWISDRSYASDQTILRMELPDAKLPEVRNRFDAMGRQRHRQAEESQNQILRQRKIEALRVLRAQCVGPAPATDIAGFVLAAVELFQQEATDKRERVLVLITDLKDNRRFDVSPDLSGVKVHIHQLGVEADPTAVSRLRREWTERFHTWGASDVQFIRPNLPDQVRSCWLCRPHSLNNFTDKPARRSG